MRVAARLDPRRQVQAAAALLEVGRASEALEVLGDGAPLAWRARAALAAAEPAVALALALSLGGPDGDALAATARDRLGAPDAWAGGLPERLSSEAAIAWSRAPTLARTELERLEAALVPNQPVRWLRMRVWAARARVADRLGRPADAVHAARAALDCSAEVPAPVERAEWPFASAPAGGARGLVLVVGMPRSGTTLLERCLSRHPGIDARGERTVLPALASALCASGVTPGADLGWLRDLLVPDGAERWVVDKLPGNDRHVDLACAVAPDTRVVHCVRDRFDTCASILLTPFAGTHPWRRSVAAVAAEYDRHLVRVAGWRSQGVPIHRVRCEALATRPEAVLRGVLAFLGLPWDDRVLSPQRAARASTASHAQVREGPHGRFLGRYDAYRPLLPELTSRRRA
ncbi:MAG: sulfotransferase [Myxococcota bacterium]